MLRACIGGMHDVCMPLELFHFVIQTTGPLQVQEWTIWPSTAHPVLMHARRHFWANKYHLHSMKRGQVGRP